MYIKVLADARSRFDNLNRSFDKFHKFNKYDDAIR